MDTIENIIKNVLQAIYEPFGFALIMAILFMFLYMYANEQGLKNVIYKWCNTLKKESNFRIVFLFAFVVSMILFRTLLNRKLWMNPLSDVIGVWSLHNDKGELTTEIIENFILFVPFIILFWCCFREKVIKTKTGFLKLVAYSIAISFASSLTIEILQLMLRLGTFQLSDLFFNTTGGLFGGITYWIGYKIKHRKNGKEV